ncbi:CPBP family intramembrane glutamic endopeptidase [Actinoplanes sp. NPDC051411]|uniref:CPBP family intramembrane glutamic endopeptidase n=1 Tax=Actinoplanes sp. NPDC051411 TaxID=3155522 RepID=UPI0034413E53
MALTVVLLAAFSLVRGRAPLILGPVFAAAFLLIAGRFSGGVPVGGTGWALGGLGLTVLVYAIALLVPFTRRRFRDPRYEVPLGRAFFTALVAVPLSTVAVEEAAFRGALWPIAWATPVLFGLWHVLPGDRTNAAAPSRWATFGFTFAAGVVLALLRHFSGGLLAPFVLHWAANGLGVVASAVAVRLDRSGR